MVKHKTKTTTKFRQVRSNDKRYYEAEKLRILSLGFQGWVNEAVLRKSPALTNESGSLRYPAIYLMAARVEWFDFGIDPDREIKLPMPKPTVLVVGNLDKFNYEILEEFRTWYKRHHVRAPLTFPTVSDWRLPGSQQQLKTEARIYLDMMDQLWRLAPPKVPVPPSAGKSVWAALETTFKLWENNKQITKTEW